MGCFLMSRGDRLTPSVGRGLDARWVFLYRAGETAVGNGPQSGTVFSNLAIHTSAVAQAVPFEFVDTGWTWPRSKRTLAAWHPNVRKRRGGVIQWPSEDVGG